ncbi:GNAT family N-acetyltransferase [Fusobacterium nucleatum]|uniref:GNAT family N-acetyltransferase n=1 Tax=Fusobacterium nucleatum TaxID=851 RepID=UPI0036F436AD
MERLTTNINQIIKIYFLNNNENLYIRVNSSRYGVPIYEKLGFVKMEEEKERDGLKFTPMKLVLKDEMK